jgi:hypothetical protein
MSSSKLLSPVSTNLAQFCSEVRVISINDIIPYSVVPTGSRLCRGYLLFKTLHKVVGLPQNG